MLIEKISIRTFAVLLIAGGAFAAEDFDIDCAREFYAERLRFDYCGTNGVVLSARGIPQDGMLLYKLQKKPDVIRRDRDFYVALKRFELAALAGKQPLEEGEEVARQVLLFRNRMEQWDLWQYVSCVEYSLLRVLDSGATTIAISDIERVLPDGLFKELQCVRNPGRGAVHKAFKNMIVISWALGKWKREHESLPEDLNVLGLEKKWLCGVGGASIEYETKDGIWQLFSPGARGGKNKAQFNVYVPVMHAPGIRFWPQASCLWLSSDYSEKRKRLYETGILYDPESSCACKLERGGIFRQ